jgi:hypothetical protein
MVKDAIKGQRQQRLNILRETKVTAELSAVPFTASEIFKNFFNDSKMYTNWRLLTKRALYVNSCMY